MADDFQDSYFFLHLGDISEQSLIKKKRELFFFSSLSHKIHIRYTFKKTVKVTQNEVG